MLVGRVRVGRMCREWQAGVWNAVGRGVGGWDLVAVVIRLVVVWVVVSLRGCVCVGKRSLAKWNLLPGLWSNVLKP